ncbi:MAG: hypothetical protein IIC50_25190 [Planctomycetes bacterium]|nr:hypothetical protein [Planctomycetota bacterium]
MAKHSKAIDLASKGVEISSGPWYPSFDIPDAFIPADVGETKLMLIRGRITGVRTVPTKSGKTKNVTTVDILKFLPPETVTKDASDKLMAAAKEVGAVTKGKINTSFLAKRAQAGNKAAQEILRI